MSPTSPVGANNSNEPSDSGNLHGSSATGGSWELDSCKITPTRREETSADIEIGTNALMDAAEVSNTLCGICSSFPTGGYSG